jgi:hypothetical protein
MTRTDLILAVSTLLVAVLSVGTEIIRRLVPFTVFVWFLALVVGGETVFLMLLIVRGFFAATNVFALWLITGPRQVRTCSYRSGTPRNCIRHLRDRQRREPFSVGRTYHESGGVVHARGFHLAIRLVVFELNVICLRRLGRTCV